MITSRTAYVNTAKLSLKRARAQLQLTQDRLSDIAKVHINVIRNCEQRRGPISIMSAYAILNALNRVRKDLEIQPLELDDLDWNVRE